MKCRVVVATHPAGTQKSRVGVMRAGVVYELFFTTLPRASHSRPAILSSCTCIVAHYGPALADEDVEQDPDRWCSYAAWGQECWQIVSQWVWNLRLELGHQLEPASLRTTEFAAAIAPATEQTADATTHAQGYGPLATATSWKAGRFSGKDFALQPDGTRLLPSWQVPASD